MTVEKVYNGSADRCFVHLGLWCNWAYVSFSCFCRETYRI